MDRHILTAFGLLVLIIVGCNRNLPDDLPKLYPCTISITQGGVPLDGATVLLLPHENEESTSYYWYPMGVTSADGTLKVVTNGRYSGAPLGKYKIVITKEVIGESKFGPPPEENTPQYEKWSLLVANESSLTFNLVEPQYADKATTPLEIEVVAQKNAMTVDVGKPVRNKMN